MPANFRLDESILELLHLQDLPEAEKTELLAKMTELVKSRVVDVVLGRLTENQRDEFDALIESDATPAQAEQFFQKAVPDFDQILAEETLRFKNQLVEDSDAVRKLVTQQ